MSTPWYKRLIARLRKSDQRDHDAHTDTYIHTYSAPRVEEPPSPSMKAKFRFPLIPDDEFQTSIDTHSRKPSNSFEQSVKPRAMEYVADDLEERRKGRIEILKERDRVFAEKGWLKKAQEVPSPVYGFNPPPKQKAAVEELMDESSSNDEKVNPLLEPTVTSELITNSYEEQTIPEKQEITPSIDQTEEEQSLVSTEVNPQEAEVAVFNEIPSGVSHDHKQDKHIETKNESKVQLETKKTKIPYNVFYFGDHGKQYQFPKLQFLKPSQHKQEDDIEWQKHMIEILEQTLDSFHVQAKVIGIHSGPTVTRIELQPAPGVKVNRITNLIDDIKLSLAAEDIRIEAPVPGRSAIGIEIPNRVRQPVNIIDILSSSVFQQSTSPMTVALGKDIEGAPVVMDLRKMPHGLIAGATGSGKSVCVNSIIISLLYKATPEEVKLILIDPKMVELAPYHDLPHLATPVVTDPKQATMALKWAVEEMDRRYELFASSGVRDIERYNQLIAATNPDVVRPALPYILIIIDELADLMMVAPADVEESIARIAQKARACGIHLLVATQRPSVDVITGMIKANIPTRIAFSVSSQVDSRTILDSVGAERLLGRGDMLLMENGSNKVVRVQGNYVSDEEIEAVCQFVRSQRKPSFLFDKESLVKSGMEEPEDELYQEAVEFVLEQGSASTSLLQRRFRIGYNRAARLIDMMEAQGVISEPSGSKPRSVLMSLEEYQSLQQS